MAATQESKFLPRSSGAPRDGAPLGELLHRLGDVAGSSCSSRSAVGEIHPAAHDGAFYRSASKMAGGAEHLVGDDRLGLHGVDVERPPGHSQIFTVAREPDAEVPEA